MVFDAQANRKWLAGGDIPLDGRRVELEAAAGVDRCPMLRDRQQALNLKFIRSAEAAVGLAFRQQALGVLGVNLQPLGLAIGPVLAHVRVARRAGALVPVDAQPVQIFDELGLIAGFGALEICVFDAQNELALRAPREKPVVERCARIAYVQQTGGRRGKPDSGNGVGHGNQHDRRWKWQMSGAALLAARFACQPPSLELDSLRFANREYANI